LIAIVNHDDTLFFESGSTLYDQSISMGFFVNALHMFGIPERANTFLLNTTETQGPYRLWNQDMFDHPWLSTFPMYGSVPYLLGHSELQDGAVAWMNSAETWVDIFTSVNQKVF
jgi:alpha 1,3-glucosidase